jgi:hypothetical protein
MQSFGFFIDLGGTDKKMTNTAILLNKGMECLVENLGLVEAERFVSLIGAEHFDYTEWRRENLFQGMTVEELSNAAMQYRRA